MRFFKGQFSRFLWIGLFNTANGYAWILGLQWITGKPLLANILGYGVGAAIGYIAHTRYTFRQQPKWRSAKAYCAVVLGSYLVNLAALKWCLTFLPAALAQVAAISVFVVLNYLGQSRYVFAGKLMPKS
jgi:putative flippase GtrA